LLTIICKNHSVRLSAGSSLVFSPLLSEALVELLGLVDLVGPAELVGLLGLVRLLQPAASRGAHLTVASKASLGEVSPG
jgi:hypothetical protein